MTPEQEDRRLGCLYVVFVVGLFTLIWLFAMFKVYILD